MIRTELSGRHVNPDPKKPSPPTYWIFAVCDGCGAVGNEAGCRELVPAKWTSTPSPVGSCPREWIDPDNGLVRDAAEQHMAQSHGWQVIKAYPQNRLRCTHCQSTNNKPTR